jgi:putative colanic acid biosysnthesis UDP-glucose lipid carrier transferase
LKKHTGRFSVYIRPFSYLIDLFVINLLPFYFLSEKLNNYSYHFFITASWFLISFNIAFYEVYRYSKATDILSKIVKQYLGYLLETFDSSQIVKFVTASLLIISVVKFSIFYFLRQFRVLFGGNFRKVVIVGNGENVINLADFFNENIDYGYKLEKIFNIKTGKKQKIESCYKYVLDNKIDEIYCSLTDLNNDEINAFIDFTDNNLKVLKFLPNSNEVLSRNLILDYYGYIPIISLRNIPLDKTTNKIIKRLFDICFSLIVIVFILSWLTPVLAIFIKIQSKGSIFFKQKRNGLNYHEFDCYKFRSMTLNDIADVEQVSKNDPRITGIGKFIRKSSIDELPQFFNVLLGEMSVVGPRPHMVSHTEMYAKRVDKFMVRHFVKPGITGLAQTNGYRGEVENEKDIIYRVKYDIFYIENWSILLDIKIIYLTIINALKGEEKAY